MQLDDDMFLSSPAEEEFEQPSTQDVQSPVSVSELTSKIRRLLETQVAEVFVEGEISGYRGAGSGHLYFDLKDNAAIIKCVVWSRDAARINYVPKDGDKVELRGRLTVYDQRGVYQIVATSLRPAGQGRLYLQFLEMKERLAAEGLFDSQRKQSLPEFPKCIGIVTSPTGSVIRDILHVLGRRAPHVEVLIFPARVQGEGAAAEIVKGLRVLNSLSDIDVIILARGGGSLEDLWCFNEEIVARAVADSDKPVISAVGHETDHTIADYVADLRAPTPSAAAEIVARESEELLRILEQTEHRMKKSLKEKYAFLQTAVHLRARLEMAVIPRVQMLQSKLKEFERSHAFQRPITRLNEMRQTVDDFSDNMGRHLADRIKDFRFQLKSHEIHINALNPTSILKRGYSITTDATTGSVISSTSQISLEQDVKILLADGTFAARVSEGTKKAAPSKSRKTRAEKVNTLKDSNDLFGQEWNEE